MAEFKLGRLRFVWQGQWITGHTYVKDDIVRYGAKSYVCMVGHAANGNFYTDLNDTTPKWSLMTDGISWKGDWQASTLYKIGDIIKQGADSHICKVGHTSDSNITSGFYTDQTGGKWDILTAGIEWTGVWDTSIFYDVGHIVKFGAKDYICAIAHTSSATIDSGFYDDLTDNKWTLLTDGQEWLGTWNTATFYKNGDIITYGSNGYICKLGHTSSAVLAGGFYLDLPTKWDPLVTGQVWKGTWATSTYYKINDITKFGAKEYICILGHTSSSTANSGFYTDLSGNKWSLLVDGVQWSGNWAQTTYYKIGDIVTYGGTTYICATGHTSQALLETDQGNWNLLVNGINFIGDWSGASYVYKVNDVVKYGADIWICNSSHTSTSTFDIIKFSIFVQGLEYVDTWDTITSYVLGDVVTYGGYTYTSLTTNNINNVPSTNPLIWVPITTGFRMQGDWTGATAYLVGDVIRNGAYTYVAILDNTNVYPPSDVLTWELLNTGFANRGTWTSGQVYKLGDVVSYISTSYVCVQPNTASTPNNPVNDITGAYWNLLSQGSTSTFNTTAGDITYRAGGGADTRLPIGSDGQVLRVINGLPTWDLFGVLPNIFYVSTEGTDAADYGGSLDKPWRTVNYACTTVVNGVYNPNARFLLSQNKNWMVEEMYYWMQYEKSLSHAPFSPSSVFDAGKTRRDAKYIVDAVTYDITRGGNSQSVDAAIMYFLPGSTNTFVNATVTSEMPYYIAAINKLLGLMGSALSNSAPAQSYQTLMSVPSPVSQVINLSYTTEAGVSAAVTTLVGIITTSLTSVSTALVPLPNQGETATIFVKNGTYAEILPISVPANVAIVGDELRGTIIEPAVGYTGSNMIYVRGGSGVRNMTLTGLTGAFTAVNSYGTRRVTGGAFVSLDPGTGPGDTSVWVVSRSPYVQNVSTIGTKCVGIKIDGSLHDGGNKSIVANDFTHVISDGIGVWCTGTGARTELVSVFTYYNYIGYLSELGGKIRATNGNNSYGELGSVSETYDVTETAITGTVTNRASQATVSRVLTDGNNILWLEYSNAGQEYSTAIYTVTGSGFNAAVSSPTILNNAVCEVRITSGGSGYISTVNSAQNGGTSTITLSAADTANSSQYLNMRILITAGKGAGQYGVIHTYNAGTKVATIYTEDTNVPGWNVAVDGTTVQTVLDSTTYYIIEPRITFASGTGTGALARAVVSSGSITAIRIINPGSGYVTPPTMTIIDTNATSAGSYLVMTQNGVLGQPIWGNRGTSYTTASVSVNGDGVAEFLQTGYFLTVENLTKIPLAGASIAISGNDNFYAVVLTASQSGSIGNYTATFQINPSLLVNNAPVHGDAITIRSQYSQVRLTGHDFLSVGTGNVVSTNYPGVPLVEPTAIAQVTQHGGGRVFYTCTDQDGNFNVGNLFTVQQATGVATLNASSFNLSGLYSLQLSGSGATITQFSTDGTFTSNSDALVPTQKAIKTYIASQLGAGGANLAVTSLTAGNIFESGNTITTLNNVDLKITAMTGNSVQFPSLVNHGTGSIESYAYGASITHSNGSADTYDAGSTLTINGTITNNTTPVNPADVPNKMYVDRTLTLNNLWTSAW